MTHTEKLHLDAIESTRFTEETFCGDRYLAVDNSKAASKSAEITKQIAIEFAKWCDERVLSDNYMTWEDWFDEFLKTKQ